MAMTYPHHPNAITKKKYYEFFQNLPLFLPVEEASSTMVTLLNQYPIQPHLDNRDTLVKWVHIIHNKVNEKLERPTRTLEECHHIHYDAYHYAPTLDAPHTRMWKQYGSFAILVIGASAILGGAFYWSKLKSDGSLLPPSTTTSLLL
jgi:hypothetical protein